MSQTGNYTPLQINALTELSQHRGFAINATAQALMGTWTPTAYYAGSFVGNTVLAKITAALPKLYHLAATNDINVSTYRAALNIGYSVCNALVNGRPNTFNATYPGYGSWRSGSMVSQSYPPRNYPNTEFSYINQQYGSYAYITGWPGTNAWQQTTDTYKAAFPPRAADASTLIDWDEYFSNGFIATVARQAYYELWSERFDQNHNMVNAWAQCVGASGQTNEQTAALTNAKTFMPGTFSGHNDLSTNDISGVNRAFRVWGEDLINCGRTIDLSKIHKFGTPSMLLLTLQKNNALTQAVGLALQHAGLDTTQLTQIFNTTYTPTAQEEKLIYEAFKLVGGNDLYSINNGITLQLNCKINTLRTLADLLDPKYLFPNSYKSLTVPQYRVDTQSSKIYYLIYNNDGVNPQVKELAKPLYDKLSGIIPDDIAMACGAFSMSMQQVKNIMQAEFQKFALSVVDLEAVDQNLNQINQATGTPVAINSVNTLLQQTAHGSGNSGSHIQADFYGSASGYPYNALVQQATDIVNQLPTQALQTTYQALYALSLTAPTNAFNLTLDLQINALITQANQNIQDIFNTNTAQCHKLNYIWNQIGTHLTTEQKSVPMAIKQTTAITEVVDQTDFQTFVKSLEQYAADNSEGGTGQTLEAICDLTTLAGQSIIAAMREARNAKKLGFSGTSPDNDISGNLDKCCASATATLDSNGSIATVTMTSVSSGYDITNPPRVNVYPFGFGASLLPVIEHDGSISELVVQNAGKNMPYVSITIEQPPRCATPDRTGNKLPPQPALSEPTFPGPTPVPTFNANPYLPGPVPPASPTAQASPTVAQAISDVITCNCDCWDL